MDETLHYKLFRRAIRRCCDHEVVSELTNPDLPLLSVFTSKKHRLPWQKTRLVREYVTLPDVLASSVSSEAVRALTNLVAVPEGTMLDGFKEHFDVDHKGNLKATAKKYAHINLGADNKFVADVDLGKVTFKEIPAEKVFEVVEGLKVQQNHFVLRERKPRSLYIVVRCDMAEKIALTSSITKEDQAGAGVDVKSDIGADASLDLKDMVQTNIHRDAKSTIGFKCSKLRINEDNTLSLVRYDFGQQRLDEDGTDGPVAVFQTFLQPFDVIKRNAEVQAVLLAWVKSCPSEDTVVFLEELIDNILSSGESAKTCQLPASWICKSFVPECLTDSTIAVLKHCGVNVVQSAHQEAELQWNDLTDEQTDLLSACLRMVGLADDLNNDQQAAVGDVTAEDAQNFIDLLVAASEVQIPKMDLADKNRSTWVPLEHAALSHLGSSSAYATLQSFGIHVGITAKDSAIFDSYLLDEGRLQNLAALIQTLCLPQKS